MRDGVQRKEEAWRDPVRWRALCDGRARERRGGEGGEWCAL